MTDALTRATQAQNRASHPARTSWVTANAGSGKTRVLTDRVARLLLKEVDAQRILCLTYTKAAAAEMQTRLFARLGGWSMLDDQPLRDALNGIGENGAAFTPDALDHARTLFARALETPGGLKIQTIHAFCAHLLRRFPLEAGVSPRFTEIDEPRARALQSQVLADMAAASPGPLDGLAAHLADEGGLPKLIGDILRHRDDFARFERATLAARCGIPPDLTEAEVLAELEANAPRPLLKRLAGAIAQAGTDNEREKKFAALIAMPDGIGSKDYLATICQGFLKQDGTLPKGLPVTKAVVAASPWVAEAVAQLQDVLLGTIDRLKAIAFLDRSDALAAFARDFLARYGQAKEAGAFLDFDDLIDRTRDLLSAYETTQWVLYRLDGGIEHILVDEAQDTAPRQWEVVEALSSGFVDHPAGTRTLFVVGDRKQSIYRFQGAEPGQLSDKQEELDNRLRSVGDALQVQPLHHSFRSAAPILQLVDATFAGDPIGAMGEAPEHLFFEDRPGRVDLWKFRESEEKDEEGEWWDPVDTVRASDPVVGLAADIAAWIRETIAGATAIPDGAGGWRAATAGDFLVLVRSRNRFFHRLIASLKSEGVPVAGADRLRIRDELAVADLLSLLRFLDNERDDLALAEALRSPLFGLSEGALFTLAHGRSGLLWETVRKRGPAPMVERLAALRDRVDFDRPHEILETVLTGQGGRTRLTARLGPQCGEAIDELLSQSLAYERNGPPTLTGFLAWLDATDAEVKRDMDAAGGELRVMTVHGAKGLEAPVVVVADTSQRQVHQGAPQVQADDGLPFWHPPAAEMPEGLAHVEAERRAAETRESARQLYVALTRAESWLVVCGAGGKADTEGRWFGQVDQAAQGLATGQSPMEGARIDHLWTPPAVAAVAALSQDTPDIAALAALPAPFSRRDPVRPSSAEGPHSLPGDTTGDPDATDRGTLIHRLIEALAPVPVTERAAAGAHCLSGAPWEDGALDQVLALLDNPSLAHLFAPDSLAEVAVTARPDAFGGREVTGRIDRLLVADDTILAVDFKSNRVVPATASDVPAAILAQMGAYALALAEVYPDRRIETAILWTETGTLMPLAHADVSRAAVVFQSLDQTGSGA